MILDAPKQGQVAQNLFALRLQASQTPNRHSIAHRLHDVPVRDTDPLRNAVRTGLYPENIRNAVLERFCQLARAAGGTQQERSEFLLRMVDLNTRMAQSRKPDDLPEGMKQAVLWMCDRFEKKSQTQHNVWKHP